MLKLNLDFLGMNIKALRLKHRLSQSELAFMCGISRSFLSQIENARAVPSLDVVVRIANCFQVSVVYLLTVPLRTSAR